jgi:hypothetical protein
MLPDLKKAFSLNVAKYPVPRKITIIGRGDDDDDVEE